MMYTSNSKVEIKNSNDGIGLIDVLRPDYLTNMPHSMESYSGIKDTNGNIVVRCDFYTDEEMNTAIRYLENNGYKEVGQVAGLFANWKIVAIK